MSILMAPVKDGKIQETNTQASLKKATTADNNGMDKDAFLQLLVAQMQYQDPLEPTSNTEYISQYAQFSQVEQMQNMASTTELARATLDYDFSEEKKFSYKNLSMDEIIRRLAVFIFGLGQIHVFSDGNITRQYLEMFWKSL